MFFHHVAIYSNCIKESVDFYQKFFHFVVINILKKDGKITGYHLKQNGGAFVLEILEGKNTEISQTFHLAFYIENVEDFYNKHKEEIKFIKKPFYLDEEVVAFLCDIDGYKIEINNKLVFKE